MLKLGLMHKMCGLIGTLVFLVAAPLCADVTIHGKVRVWNPIINDYEPLRQARVRIVLWEFEDWDTGDLEVWTNDNGDYSGTKGNPWWRSGYNVFMKAFAETDRVEIQDMIPQVDGYQAYSRQVWAPQDATTTIDLDIGHTASNVTGYRVGGVSALWTGGDTDAVHGERAFWMCNEMTDHVQTIIRDTVAPSRYLEEKEVVFPFNSDTVANYNGFWDAVYVPDAHFNGTTLEYQDSGFRHELGHGLMMDAFGCLDWPGSWYATSHTFWDPVPDGETAWKEGWADFQAEWTFFKRYGRHAEDIISLDNTDRVNSMRAHPGDRAYIEAEVNACLWSIVDGIGWKKRANQVGFRPGEEQYYDAIQDPRWGMLWPAFQAGEPGKFCDLATDTNTLVNQLVDRSGVDQYALKVMLQNRGVQSFGGQRAPSIDYYNSGTWNGADWTVPFRIREADTLDHGHLMLEVYVNGTRVSQEQVPAGGWERVESYQYNGYEKQYEITYHHIAPRAGRTPSGQQRHPIVRVAVDDGMECGYYDYTLDPPAGAQIDDLRCNVWKVVVKNGMGKQLKDMGVTAGFTGTKPSVRLGPWTADNRYVWEGDQQVFQMTGGSVPDSFALDFSVTGVKAKGGGELVIGASSAGTVTDRYTDADNFGIGDHVATISIGEGLAKSEVEVSYSIYIPNPAIARLSHLSQSVIDRMHGVPETSLAVRNINMGAVRRAAYDTPGANLGSLMKQANHLLDDYARLQSEILEIEGEIEAKLNPEKASKFHIDKSRPVGLDGSGKEIRLLQPAMIARKVIAATPQTPFLDDATSGKAQVTKVAVQNKKALTDMRAQIAEKQKQMADLCGQAPKLRTTLLESAEVVRNSSIAQSRKDTLLSGVPDLEQRLASLCPSANEYSPILEKEMRVIDLALGQPINDTAKPPVKEEPGAVTPENKYPPKEEPANDKLPGTLVPTAKTPVEQTPAETPARMGETARWQLQVTDIRYADDYAEKYYQEKRVIEPKSKGDRLILLSCRLTNKLEKTQVPVLSERLAGTTVISMGASGAFPPLDYDARQAINKIQGYDAASVMPGGSLDFVLVFSVPSDSKPDMLLFNFLNYPDDVGGEGKSVKIPL